MWGVDLSEMINMFGEGYNYCLDCAKSNIDAGKLIIKTILA